MSRQTLPIGIQTFAKLRTENCYYVDKTPFIPRLLTHGSHFFLSRPRRFGKSLFLDTLKELFEGNEALFTGLAIHPHWDWSVKYPVLRFSFGSGSFADLIGLQQSLNRQLTEFEEAHGLPTQFPDAPSRFAFLLQHLHAQTGQRVVVLVDEYDKPILDNIEKPESAAILRNGLRDFYSVIKDQDAHIKFTFLTGVSKFSKVSIFSGLNNLKDITLDQRYSAICGYTDDDVNTVFADQLEGLDRQEIRRWYNGYNWGGTSVYNPFDLLLLFDSREFRPYWFETGTPTFLVKLLSQRKTFTPNLEKIQTHEALLSTFDIDNIPTETLMFQAGYLTIDTIRRIPGVTQMILRYPNQEVRSSLNGALLQTFSDDPSRYSIHAGELYDLLLAKNIAGMQSLFTSLFASNPNDWYRNNPIAQYEGYYASVFYSHFAALGLDITLEDVTNKGRIDMTVQFEGQVYLFEFKVVELVPEGKALEQLKARNYAQKYLHLNQPIHLIGVEFSKESRNVVGFETETIV